MKKLIVIGGATATGKTALAIRLAKHLDTAILSADSRQFYREMSIGTAKASASELAEAPHHFIDVLSVADDYSVGDFERDALARLAKIYEKKEVAILVGGSGLYIRAVCEGLDKFPDISTETKKTVEAGENSGGITWLQHELAERDPLHFSKIDSQNPARLRRALEVCVESDSPRAYEVLANLINTAADLNTKLIDIHQREQKLNGTPEKPEGTTTITNNAVFVGTSADLNAAIAKRLASP